jgi:choline dehydrogenase-like flavoprotein
LFFDARKIPNHEVVEADVCIIGAGAAGITLARELNGGPLRVCLLAGGGLEYDLAGQALYQGTTSGALYTNLSVSRLRYFGGTTGHWDGRCRPLDAIDFEYRDWVPHSGWPISKAELEPYYARAQDVLQLGPARYESAQWESGSSQAFRFLGDRALSRVYLLSPPTRFGREYRSEIANSSNIAAYLHANAVELHTTENTRVVSKVDVACLEGARFAVSARVFILAAGGIENARLLLVSRRKQKTGLGNGHDVVGRYYMDHLESRSGLMLLSKAARATDFYRIEYKTPRRFQALLTLSEATQRSEKLLNSSMLLFPNSWDSAMSKGPTSIRYMLDSIKNKKKPERILHHLRNVITDVDDVAKVGWGKLAGPETEVRVVENTLEQVPDPNNRITLAAERDPLGMNRVLLEWRYGDAERNSLVRTQEILAQELGKAALGRLKIEAAPGAKWENHAGEHHMGATRMSADPKQGVVDAKCRVHGIANLYVAGSSVFPTGGYANPTLTLVALALRLADHVKEKQA